MLSKFTLFSLLRGNLITVRLKLKNKLRTLSKAEMKILKKKKLD